VIPKWVATMIRGGCGAHQRHGEISRDFCYVANVVQANLLAATVESKDALNQAYNVAPASARHSPSSSSCCAHGWRCATRARRPRAGARAVPGRRRHALARRHRQGPRLLGYEPTHLIDRGLDESLAWYEKNLG
jgi:UDP-N-acetylglucosamine 4-epimerase